MFLEHVNLEICEAGLLSGVKVTPLDLSLINLEFVKSAQGWYETFWQMNCNFTFWSLLFRKFGLTSFCGGLPISNIIKQLQDPLSISYIKSSPSSWSMIIMSCLKIVVSHHINERVQRWIEVPWRLLLNVYSILHIKARL